MKKQKTVFVSCAWPYANGSLHVGHIAALLPSDVFARYHHLAGDDILYVSGSDTHGTPISVRAERENKKPEQLANHYHNEFKSNLQQLCFSFDLYGLYTETHTKEHERVVQDIFLALFNKGFIEKRKEMAMYDPESKRFLPDRYIEGECPFCHFDQARGDQCDSCGRLLDPRQLINPKSKLSSSSPIEKETEHFYFLLSKKEIQKELKQYISKIHHVRKNTKEYTENFLGAGLHDRAITRDLDWGVPLPKEIGIFPSKRMYVWFEAVCGYLSASKTWAADSDAWERFWLSDSVLAYYVYGKDNIPFHTVIWPAILIAYSYATGKKFHLPDIHVASEYVQIEGKKLSTSRHWAIWIPDLLKDFSSDAIRYALLALNPETSDTNFSFKEFQAKNNNELLATLGNFIQRTIALAEKAHITLVPKKTHAPFDIQQIYIDVQKDILAARLKSALSRIMDVAKKGNKFLDETQPWHTIKTNPNKAVQDIGQALRLCSQFAVFLLPFLPNASSNIANLFSLTKKNFSWEPCVDPLEIHKLQQPLFTKIEDSLILKHEKRLCTKNT
ncbi:MAG: methionine--tRNA ligase [Patescibacteria group bacterium]|jgi:methionyl-tRNA synthetase